MTRNSGTEVCNLASVDDYKRTVYACWKRAKQRAILACLNLHPCREILLTEAITRHHLVSSEQQLSNLVAQPSSLMH
jgi:hypothetical protein